MVVDPQGRIVRATARPEQLKSDQLLDLAAGKRVVLGGDVDPQVEAQLKAATAEAMAAQPSSPATPTRSSTSASAPAIPYPPARRGPTHI
jgi:hypothetical protein